MSANIHCSGSYQLTIDMSLKSESTPRTSVKQEDDMAPVSDSTTAVYTNLDSEEHNLDMDSQTRKRQQSGKKKRVTSKMDRLHRSSRATTQQLEGLVDIMESDSKLANGRVLHGHRGRYMVNPWVAVAKKLNYGYPGLPKKVSQWQKVWSELKRRTKNNLKAQEEGHLENKTVKPLNAIELRVARILDSKQNQAEDDKSSANDSDDDLPISSQNQDYGDDSAQDDSQLELFPGWGQAAASSSRRPAHNNHKSATNNNCGGIKKSLLEQALEPSASTGHQQDYSKFMERLLHVEESRQRSEAQRDEHREWCDRKFMDLEENRQRLEQQRMELEERRLQEDQRRLQVDQALLSVLQVMSRK